MDTEKLKLILETLNNAGEGAYKIALLYISMDALRMLLTFCGVVIALLVVERAVRMITVHIAKQENTAQGWREICLMLGDQSASFLPTKSETNRIVLEVRQLIEKHNEKTK